MKAAKKQHDWARFLEFFSEQNAGRTTRLGLFELSDNIVTDYWLEDGLPLAGIDIDTKKELPSVQITVGSFTHEIKDAVNLLFRFSLKGDEDGIDVTTADGQTTVLRFEKDVAA